MYSNLRSLIFKVDPEKAHFLAIQSLKLNLVSNIFDKNKNDPILKTKLYNKTKHFRYFRRHMQAIIPRVIFGPGFKQRYVMTPRQSARQNTAGRACANNDVVCLVLLCDFQTAQF